MNEKKKSGNASDKTETTPRYKSRYSNSVQASLKKILNREDFSYNVNSDKLFSRYKDSYTAAGKKAMEDTMGNAALLTGGYGNSYAVTAGQQAYNDYMQKLSDKSAQLEQQAYDRYRDEEQSAYNRLNALMELENTDYDRYRDTVSDYNQNREFEYNKIKDEQNQRNWQAQFDRAAYESDRDYNRKAFEFNFSNGLQEAIDGEKLSSENKEVFNPEDAYSFLSKYNNIIYDEEEFLEALVQMYAGQEGFFEWLATVDIPGDIAKRSYLDLLYQRYPQYRKTVSQLLEMSEDELIAQSATNGGASIPSLTNFWGIYHTKHPYY